MKRRLLTVTISATFALSNNSMVFAACADEVPIQAARMTTSALKIKENIELLNSAFSLLREAKTLCSQGNESGADNILQRLKVVLNDLGR